MKIIPRIHNRLQTSHTTTQASRNRQQGEVCHGYTGLKDWTQWWSPLGLNSLNSTFTPISSNDITPSSTSSKATYPATSQIFKNKCQDFTWFFFFFYLKSRPVVYQNRTANFNIHCSSSFCSGSVSIKPNASLPVYTQGKNILLPWDTNSSMALT